MHQQGKTSENKTRDRTIRAREAGQVLHYATEDGRFMPGQIVTAVTIPNMNISKATVRKMPTAVGG